MNVKPNTQDAKPVDDKRSRHVRPQDMPWDKMRFPGCQTKTLLFDPKSGLATVLIKMEPGATLPDHEHAKIAAGEQRRRRERTERATEHDRIVETRAHALPPARRNGSTRPAAMSASTDTSTSCSAAWTRMASDCSSSPGSTGTARCAMIEPVSTPSSTK